MFYYLKVSIFQFLKIICAWPNELKIKIIKKMETRIKILHNVNEIILTK